MCMYNCAHIRQLGEGRVTPCGAVGPYGWNKFRLPMAFGRCARGRRRAPNFDRRAPRPRRGGLRAPRGLAGPGLGKRLGISVLSIQRPIWGGACGVARSPAHAGIQSSDLGGRRCHWRRILQGCCDLRRIGPTLAEIGPLSAQGGTH